MKIFRKQDTVMNHMVYIDLQRVSIKYLVAKMCAQKNHPSH